MKMLHHKVNIVPVIAKADMLTKKEVARLKKRVTELFLYLHFTFQNQFLIEYFQCHVCIVLHEFTYFVGHGGNRSERNPDLSSSRL